MDIFNLELDFGGLANLIGVFAALYISKEWKDQKRTEVIAQETKEIIAILLKNQIILGHIKNEAKLANVKAELNYIKDEYFNCLGRIMYLEMSISEDLSDLIKKLGESYINLLQIAEIQLDNPSHKLEEKYFDRLKSNEGLKSFQQYVDDINTYSSEIIEKIYLYSIYKKYINI